MKVIIAGSRNITDCRLVSVAVRQAGFLITEIISGGARGIDTFGEEYANEMSIPVKRFIPDWAKYGKSAGILRNVEMAEYAEALIAIWDRKSRGTKHMIETATKKGLKIFVLNV